MFPAEKRDTAGKHDGQSADHEDRHIRNKVIQKSTFEKEHQRYTEQKECKGEYICAA